jgi:hypothetical protein
VVSRVEWKKKRRRRRRRRSNSERVKFVCLVVVLWMGKDRETKCVYLFYK